MAPALFLFFFFWWYGVEFRASHLLRGRCSTTWIIPPAHFMQWVFSDKVSQTNYLPGAGFEPQSTDLYLLSSQGYRGAPTARSFLFSSLLSFSFFRQSCLCNI
jgi:hypothetical protein